MEHRINLTNMKCNQTIDIQFRNLSYAVSTGYRKPKKPILDGLNGFFRFTELTAIMGPSGAGKTTLLNILSGFQKGLYTGTVEYLNKGNKQDWNKCKKQLCYIQQTNHLHDFFTVYEIMMIASFLKIDSCTSRQSRQTLIDDILNMLKIPYIKKTRVDQLSGGEKKRLSIALELIDNPSIMFLDEPTTGLDLTAAIQCVTVLKTLAQTGRTIVCTIHQPNTMIYEMFDHIYLVVEGHCVYRSPPVDTVDYLARQGLQCPRYHNPADFMLEVVSKEYGNYNEQLIAAIKRLDELDDEARSCKSSCDIIEKIADNNQMVIPTNPPKELKRFRVLLQRTMIFMHRDRIQTYGKFMIDIFIAILLSLSYNNIGNDGSRVRDNIYYIFLSKAYIFYSNLMPALIRFPLEVEILRKEHFNNWYQLRTYYMAMLVCAMLVQMISVFIYALISYYLTRQPLEMFRFSMYLLIGTLFSFISSGIGLGLSAVFNYIVHALFAGCFILITMEILSGLMILFTEMPSFLYYTSYLNVGRYSFEGFIISVYGYNREKLSCTIDFCYWQNPSTIFKMLSMTESMFWFDVAFLFGSAVIFYLLAYMLIKRRVLKIQ